MHEQEINVVTGAFSFSGKFISRQLLCAGKQVRTLTNHPQRQCGFDRQVLAFPMDFADPHSLIEAMEGATTLYNTYWIRYPRRGGKSYQQAVKDSEMLIQCAAKAGIRRVVHISVANPELGQQWPYYTGKLAVEEMIMASELSYAIVRPTILFGLEGILINNIAWSLRHMPIFGIFGKGDYPIQPLNVEDLAEIAASAGEEDNNIVVDAAGPDTFTFHEFVDLIRQKIGSPCKLLHMPPRMALLATRFIGLCVKDTIITRDEMEALMAGMLASHQPSLGQTHLADWLTHNAQLLGVEYLSETSRR